MINDTLIKKYYDKIIPDELVINFINEYLDQNNLNNYVKKIIISNSIGYLPSKKELHISFKNPIKRQVKITGMDTYYINILKLILSFHELSHIEQIKYIDEHNDEISFLFKLSYYLQITKNDIYSIIHDKFPHEYNAEIKAILNLKELLDNMDEYYKRIDLILQKFIDKNYGKLCPYDDFRKHLQIPNNLINLNNLNEQNKLLIGYNVKNETKIKIRGRLKYGERNL